MENINQQIDAKKSYKTLIWILSIAIPVVVAVLLYLPQKLEIGSWVYLLPDLNAVLNSATALALLLGLYFIKQKNIKAHRLMMSTAFTMGSIFLVSYVLYHSSADSTVFGDLNGDGILQDSEMETLGGGMRGFYVGILLSHILLAAVVVPFVLFAMYFALTNKIEKHKKVVKWTFPIWLYVSITGVIVYLMISPYYLH